MAKRIIKITAFTLLGLIGAMILLVGGYVLYVVIQYDRIDDNVALEIKSNQERIIDAGGTYSIATYNIGFGAYSPEFSFFMDSGTMLGGKKVTGKYGKAISKADVLKNVNGALSEIKTLDCDFVYMQEVDEDASRSYHVNQLEMARAIEGYGSVYAENFHSAYLFWPLSDPHGASNAGLVTLSKFKAEDSVRRSFPVSKAFPDKYMDLDRCFSVTRLDVGGGHKLVLINQHMSAYDKGGKIREAQLAMLGEVMLAEYDNGNNYVICGGDFNHDIAASKTLFPTQQETPTWTYPLTNDNLPEGFRIAAAVNAPSCRAAEIPYEKGVNHTVVIDGFIVSDNVVTAGEGLGVTNIDTDFAWSDHNPVKMTFRLG